MFSETNQPEKRRGPGARGLVLRALDRFGMNDEDLLVGIIGRAMDSKDKASGQLLVELLARVNPMPRAALATVAFDFPREGTPAAQVQAVAAAAAEGKISPDVAKIFADLINIGLDIAEKTELAERLERIEKLLGDSVVAGT